MLLHPPSEEIKKRMDEELNQDPDKTAEDIKYLKEWLVKQPHLPQNIDDIIIERFLYVSKYSLERCKKLLDNHYTLRAQLSKYLCDVDPASENMRDSIHVCYKIILPKCTPDGYRITMFGLLDADESKFVLETFIQRDFFLLLSHVHMESNFGVVAIYDTRGFSAAHVKKLLPLMNDIAAISKDTLPLRIKQIHIVCVSQFVKVFLQALTPLMKQKMRERVHIHSGDLESLYSYIPQEMLPENFGGQSGTIEEINESWQKMFEDLKDWLIEELAKKSDESKRPAECQRNYIFGTEGSFRSLNID